jgi:flagellar basal body rod protein FlgG
MKRNVVLFILFVFSYNAFANDNNLLNEYKLLFNDISNIRTVSYKSYFNIEYNSAFENINMSQGSLFMTEVLSDFAITGEGYFKIRLENDVIGWTRAGILTIDSNGDIRTNRGYYLYDNINLPETYIPQSLRITNDGNIYVSIYEERNNIVEVYTGQILIYTIPTELLFRYSETIYIIKQDVEYNEELSNSRIIQGALEMSNVTLLPVILRMYYILSVINENLISNIELKKELLKIQINYMANYFSLENMLYLGNNNIVNLYDLLEGSNLFNTENEVNVNDTELTLQERLLREWLPGRNINRIVSRIDFNIFLDERYLYVVSILPYLKYDY